MSTVPVSSLKPASSFVSHQAVCPECGWVVHSVTALHFFKNAYIGLAK